MAQGTNIAEQIQDLAKSRAAIIAALKAKGVTVPDGAKFEDLSALADTIDLDAKIRERWENDSSLIEKITIPEGIEKIGDFALYFCGTIKKIDIPFGVKTIGRYAFYACQKLEELFLPDGITEIGIYAFAECRNLSSLSLPKTLKIIGEKAFYNFNMHRTNGVNELIINSEVSSIGKESFYSAYISSLIIEPGETILTISERAFIYCTSLKEQLVIPSRVEWIGEKAFHDCPSLTSIVIEEGVQKLYSYAFYGCKSLASLSIQSSIKIIGAHAFYNCPSTCDIQFAKTMAEVKALANYPWGIKSGAVIHCTDGDLTIT